MRYRDHFKTLPRCALLLAIRLYQRFLSPYKGFSCAYRRHTGRASCSALGYRAVRRFGVFAGLGLLRGRTYRCGVAHRRRPQRTDSTLSAQRGVCDLSCDLPGDGCDLPSGRCFSGLGDFLSCFDCAGCDWPSSKNKDKKKEQSVYIPPGASRTGR